MNHRLAFLSPTVWYWDSLSSLHVLCRIKARQNQKLRMGSMQTLMNTLTFQHLLSFIASHVMRCEPFEVVSLCNHVVLKFKSLRADFPMSTMLHSVLRGERFCKIVSLRSAVLNRIILSKKHVLKVIGGLMFLTHYYCLISINGHLLVCCLLL